MLITEQKLSTLPNDLPIPEDDGAANHLLGLMIPHVRLIASDGQEVLLSEASHLKPVVLFCYPMTGKPGEELPFNWEEIPGARGCTPQNCSFRDNYQEITSSGVVVFGLSIQTTTDQQEAVGRLHLPFLLLSDAHLNFANELRLPLFEVDGVTFIKRLTMIIWKGEVIKVFYPVFPPDKNAREVAQWLAGNPIAA